MRYLKLCLLAALAVPAHAEDVLDWTPPDAGVVVAVRGVTVVKNVLDATEKRFGDIPRVRDAVGRLRAWQKSGVAPGKADFGAGLKLDRGLAVFVIREKQGRLVFGTDDVKAGIKRLAELMHLVDAPIAADDGGFTFAGASFSCAQRGQFAVCDSGAVPEKAPGLPAWLEEPRTATDGAYFTVVRAGLIQELSGNDAPVNEVWVAAKAEGERFVVSAEVVANPLVMAPFAMLLADAGPTPGLETVDARSAGVLKVAFDGPKMLNAINTMGSRDIERMPPEIRAIWDQLRVTWSGALVVSFPGGFFHPLVSIGLQDEAAGRKLLDMLTKSAAQVDEVTLAVGKTALPGVERIEVGFEVDPGAPKTRLAFPFAIHQKRLLLGLHPPDVARVVGGTVQSTKLPEAFSARGTHGFLAWDALGMLSMASGFEVLSEGDGQLILDVQTLATVGASLLEELGMSLTFTETGGKARLWWSSL